MRRDSLGDLPTAGAPAADRSRDDGQLVFVIDGVVIDTRPEAAQDARGVDLTLVDRTLAMSPDDRVRRLDAVLNSVLKLRGRVGVCR